MLYRSIIALSFFGLDAFLFMMASSMTGGSTTGLDMLKVGTLGGIMRGKSTVVSRRIGSIGLVKRS